MKKLIAGPWVGEFGWELFAWQGYIRAMSRKYDQTTVISRINSEPLYKDFCNIFYANEPVGGVVDSFYMQGVDFKEEFKKNVVKNKIFLDKNTTLFIPRRIGLPPFTHYSQPVIFGEHAIKPEYKIYGSERKDKYDYVFHIRDRQLVRPEDNWDIANWKQLKEFLGKGKKIACIGTVKESGWIDGTEDLRNIELQTLFDILYNCECVFGPSSGPMHLASLCNAPHVVWSTGANKIRYEENWNPHNTKVCFLSDYEWHPSAAYVYEKYLHFKENCKT